MRSTERTAIQRSPMRRLREALAELGEGSLDQIVARSGLDRSMATACLELLLAQGRVQRFEWKPRPAKSECADSCACTQTDKASTEGTISLYRISGGARYQQRH